MKKFVIILVVVCGLLVAADFGAAAAAEYEVSQKMRAQLGLTQDPEVRINGFPFLTQALSGDYQDVELSAPSVRVGQLSDVGIEATLRDAQLAPGEVLRGSVSEIKVGELQGRVKIKAADVGRLLGITDLTINPAPKDALSGGASSAGAGSVTGATGPSTTVDPSKATVALDGTGNIAGEQTKVRVIAVLSLLNGQLKLEPRKLDLSTGSFGDINLPPVFEESLLKQFDTTLDPGGLPFKITPTGVSVERGALIVQGTASDVTVGMNGMSNR